MDKHIFNIFINFYIKLKQFANSSRNACARIEGTCSFNCTTI